MSLMPLMSLMSLMLPLMLDVPVVIVQLLKLQQDSPTDPIDCNDVPVACGAAPLGHPPDHLVRDDDAIRNDDDLADRASSSCSVAPTICYHVPSPKAGARVGSKARS